MPLNNPNNISIREDEEQFQARTMRIRGRNRYEAVVSNPLDFISLLEEFNTAFRHGIREVTVIDGVFYDLLAYINRQRRSIDELEMPIGYHLILNTAGGPLKITKEGAPSFTVIDFDRYMEEV